MLQTNSYPFTTSSTFTMTSHNRQQSQTSYGQQSQSPHGQRAHSPWASSHQVASSRPGTPSRIPQHSTRSQSPLPMKNYPGPTAAYLADPLRPMQYTNYQQPVTHTGDCIGRHQYPVAAAPTGMMYSNPTPRYPPETNQYLPSQYIPDNRDPRGQQFFPTPSQAMLHQQHSGGPAQSHHRSSSVSSPLNSTPSSRTAAASPAAVPPSQHYPSLQYPSQYAASSAMQPNYASTSTSGERFPCSECDASFGRTHDRKRHYETHHLESPPVHKCQFCLKGFSRGDSLKRHVDNGCDALRTE